MYHAPGIKTTRQLLIEDPMHIVPRYESYGLRREEKELIGL